MSYTELYVSPPFLFSGLQKTIGEADYIVLGVPFDETSTYRAGARFAPMAIREASLNLETYSMRSGVDVEDVSLHDLGDLHVVSEVGETLHRLEVVVEELIAKKKVPICIGGEHTLSLGAVRSVHEECAVLSFDAHLDLRNEYLERTISHTTFMRRLAEEIDPENIWELGTRAVCREEVEYAEEVNLQFITVQQIRKEGVEKTIKNVTNFLEAYKKIYITIDMDVLDPAFAPAVQNPEPDGLSMSTFLDLLCRVCCNRVIAFDVVEVTPHYDRGVTAIQAAKTIFEVLCHLEKK